jgi:hypothetical protein
MLHTLLILLLAVAQVSPFLESKITDTATARGPFMDGTLAHFLVFSHAEPGPGVAADIDVAIAQLEEANLEKAAECGAVYFGRTNTNGHIDEVFIIRCQGVVLSQPSAPGESL